MKKTKHFLKQIIAFVAVFIPMKIALLLHPGTFYLLISIRQLGDTCYCASIVDAFLKRHPKSRLIAITSNQSRIKEFWPQFSRVISFSGRFGAFKYVNYIKYSKTEHRILCLHELFSDVSKLERPLMFSIFQKTGLEQEYSSGIITTPKVDITKKCSVFLPPKSIIFNIN